MLWAFGTSPLRWYYIVNCLCLFYLPHCGQDGYRGDFWSSASHRLLLVIRERLRVMGKQRLCCCPWCKFTSDDDHGDGLSQLQMPKLC